MLVQRVDAQHFEPVADAFHVLETQVPPAAAVGLAQGPPLAELVGDAGEFPDHPGVAELGVGMLGILIPQAIDGWPLVPGIHGHVVGHGDAVGPLVVPIVARPFEVIGLAVVVAGF